MDLTSHDLDINLQLDTEIDKLLNRNNNKKIKTILVLSGGGPKGIAQLGALHCLKKNNMLDNIKNIAATSVGSMVGLLYSIGYQPFELFKFLRLIDLNKINNMDAHNLISKYGLDDGTRMILVLKKLLNAKGYDSDISFKNLYKKTKINLIVTGSCINDKKIYYFSHTSYPDMKVLDAVRISISVPIIFTPCVFEGKIFVDGGCIDNFPIHLFSNTIENVIGVYVAENREYVQEIKFIEEYLNNTIQCLFEGVAQRDTLLHSKHIVHIKCSYPKNSKDSKESDIEIVDLFDNGYVTTQNKIDAGDFEIH